MAHEIHELVAEGDLMGHLTYRGVHDGRTFGLEPTGNAVEVVAYLQFSTENDEIPDLDWLSDDLGLIRQRDIGLPIDE